MNKLEDSDEIILKITEDDRKNFKRLDQFLNSKTPELSRTFIKKLFQNEMITTSDQCVKLELKKLPKSNVEIIIQVPPPLPSKLEAQNIPLEILYEDEHLVIINKPAGLVTHPAIGHPDNTLVNAILFHCPDLKGVGEEKRPGIVHRLDKGTSGVMVVAKTSKAHEGLVLLFSKHNIHRYYEAISVGPEIPIGGTLKSNMGRDPKNRLKMAANVTRGAKEAITHYKVLDSFNKVHHIELKLQTGRTHQIRVHLSELLKQPILCDSLYSSPKHQLSIIEQSYSKVLNDYPHPLLHAKILGFVHPITNKEIYIETDPPKIFQETLNNLRSLKGEKS